MYFIKTVLVLFVFLTAGISGQINEGDPCTDIKTGEPGICTIIGDCAEALKSAIFNGSMPQVCSHLGTLQIVCCPRTSPVRTSCLPLAAPYIKIQKTGRKSWDHCIDLADTIFPCEKSGERWVRENKCPGIPSEGTSDDGTVPSGEFPHLVNLGKGDFPDIHWRCTGSFISDQWVLTSAGCSMFFGPLKYAAPGGDSPEPNKIALSDIYSIIENIRHPEYNLRSKINDICLVKIDRNAGHAACLHTHIPLPDDGFVYTGKNNDDRLQKMTMVKISHAECSRTVNLMALRLNNDTIFCCKNVKPLRILKNKCQFEMSAGSPVQIYNGNRVACTHLLVGIISRSFGESCREDGHFTAIFTRVAPYVSWIEGIVWP